MRIYRSDSHGDVERPRFWRRWRRGDDAAAAGSQEAVPGGDEMTAFPQETSRADVDAVDAPGMPGERGAVDLHTDVDRGEDAGPEETPGTETDETWLPVAVSSDGPPDAHEPQDDSKAPQPGGTPAQGTEAVTADEPPEAPQDVRAEPESAAAATLSTLEQEAAEAGHPPSRGYRASRLSARRQRRRRGWAMAGLYAVAACVALAAVLGAYFLVRSWNDATAADPDLGRVVLMVTRDPGGRVLPSAWLALYDVADGSYDVFTVPRALLLEGPQGEYVMAGDLMGGPQLRSDLGRLIGAAIPVEVDLTYAQLRRLSGGAPLTVDLAAPAALHIGDAWRTFEGSTRLRSRDIGDYLGSRGRDGEDEDIMARAVLTAVFHDGALMTADRRNAVADSLSAGVADEQQRLAAQRAFAGLLDKPVKVRRLPSRGKVSEGQFAFRPDRPRIMALVTRLTPTFGAEYTVLVRNGTGEAGIGQLVRNKLASLNAQLPTPGNADSFNYKRTEILAGEEALSVAEDVRAILGRGVVLSGKGLPPRSVVVIIGADLKAKDLQ